MTQNAINNTASSMAIQNISITGNTISSTNSNGDIILAPNGSGNISITAAPIVPSTDRADSLGSTTNSWDNIYCDGISFDDGSNILGNYTVTGSFTPSLTFGGGSTGLTYGTQRGTYSQIGKIVFYIITITLTNKGSSSGVALVSGLPSSAIGSENFNAATYWSNINLTGTFTTLVTLIPAATNTVQLSTTGNNLIVANLTDVNFNNNSSFRLTGFYISS